MEGRTPRGCQGSGCKLRAAKGGGGRMRYMADTGTRCGTPWSIRGQDSISRTTRYVISYTSGGDQGVGATSRWMVAPRLGE